MKEDPPVNKDSAVYRMIMEEKERSVHNHVEQRKGIHPNEYRNTPLWKEGASTGKHSANFNL